MAVSCAIMMIDYSFSYTNVLVTLVTAVALTWLYRKAKYAYLARKWRTAPPTKARGSLITFVRSLRDASQNGKLLDLMAQQLKDAKSDTISISFLGSNFIASANPAVFKAILAQQCDDFDLGQRQKAFGPLLGHGIFVADGQKWKFLRELLKPHFAREHIGHVATLEPHVQNLAVHIRNYHGASFDIQLLFLKLTMDVATEFFMGESVHSLKVGAEDDKEIADYERKKKFDPAMLFLSEYMFGRVALTRFYWIMNLKKFRDNVQFVLDFVLDMVNRGLEATPEQVDEKIKNGRTFLYELMTKTRDPLVLREETLNIIMAGRSTTAGLLSAVFYELSRHPDVWERLRAEIAENFGRGDPADELNAITFESLKRCVFLRYVLNETLRLHPPIPRNARVAKRDTTLPAGGGPDGKSPMLVKKGDLVALQIYVMHRLEELYGPDAHLYIPDRWKNLTKIGWGFMPFSTGPRVCLGQQYALTEAGYVTVRLAQMFPNLVGHNSPITPPPKKAAAVANFVEGVNVSLS